MTDFDAARRARRRLQVGDRRGELQLLRDLRRVEQHRAPVVVGRCRVVRIGDGDEIRDARPGRLGGRRGAPARGREEERVGDLAVVEDDLALRRVDRGVRRGRLGLDAAVDLAARVAVEVELAPFARFASAYERAATACAFSASGGQADGISAGTTPFRYASSPTTSITWTSLPSLETTSLPRYALAVDGERLLRRERQRRRERLARRPRASASGRACPGSSATFVPVASVTVQATVDVERRLLAPAASSTRTVVTFAGPSVVPV